MEAPDEDKEVNSLEDPDISTQSTEPTDNNKLSDDSGAVSTLTFSRTKKLSQRVQNLITHINIYLLLFILIVVLAGGIVFIGMQRSKLDLGNTNLGTQQLTTEELAKISGSDSKVGDPKQTLTIESNSIFTGKVLLRDNLDVAGEIKVGSGLNVAGLTVSGLSTFGQIAASELTIAGSASIQGQLNARGNLAVTGNTSFGGLVSATQITVQNLRISGDLELSRHIDAGGPSPSKSNGTALGSGGTSSISGTDTAGTLAINTGSSPGAGCFATIAFSQPFNSTPHVVVSPIGSAGAEISYYINRSSTSFSICTTTSPPSGASFSFDYIVID